MKRTLTFIVLFFVMLVGSVNAQNEKAGLAKLEEKDFVAAKQIFSAILKSDPKNATALYGMGEYYYNNNNKDSAKICFQNGVNASSSNPYNYVGLGKINLLSNPVEAEANFKNAVKKSKKDAGAIVAIAWVYYDQTPKKIDEAKKYLDLAIGVDPKSASAYFLYGLIDLDKSDASHAALNFDRAIFFNPNNLDSYLHASKIMMGTRNYNQAVEYLNKALAINPKFWPAYKSLGELYYDIKKYPESVNSFATYFKNVPEDKDVTHYAYSLFFNKQYDEANQLLQGLLKKNPNDYILLRLLAYISFETKDLVNGKAVMEKYFSLVPADKILDDDYSYYGKMLSASGEDSLAIVNYKMALQKDSSQFQLYDEISKSYKQLKQLDSSLYYSAKFVQKKPAKTTVDYFNLAKAYYLSANSLKPDSIPGDSLKQKEYLLMADSLFGQVETYSPTSYLGSFWRARVNSLLDPDATAGLAKPYYEKALEILMKDPVKYKKEIAEVYAYLGFYYFQQKDEKSSIASWNKLLEIDPGNAKAQEALNYYEKKKKAANAAKK